MPNYKLPKELRNRMERELRQYYDNKKKLDRLKNLLIQEKPKTTDPTGQKVVSFESTRTLLYLEERLHYVENVYNQLRPYEQEIYDCIFRKAYNPTYCETQENIGKSTYYNVFNKSVYLLALEWGEI